ncbi:MAG: hypothetical protein R2729_29730 [Bryobacteraceae bacterium]
MKPVEIARLIAVLVWSFGVIGLSAYLFQPVGRIGKWILIAVDSGLVALAIAWMNRSGPFGPRRPRYRRAPTTAENYAKVAGQVRAIADAELVAGNRLEYCQESEGRFYLRFAGPFRTEPASLPRQERFGWEHYYENPDGTAIATAHWRTSSAETPVLCEHLRGVEVAMHRAGIRLNGQYGTDIGVLSMVCELQADAAKAAYGLAECVEAREVEWMDRFDRVTEGWLVCHACGLRITGAGGRRFPDFEATERDGSPR